MIANTIGKSLRVRESKFRDQITLVVGYKRKDFWLDISARDTFSQKTVKIVGSCIGARQKFALVVVGYKRKSTIWTKIMLGYKR